MTHNNFVSQALPEHNWEEDSTRPLSEESTLDIKKVLANGLEKCSCVRVRCERYGKCEECINHHKTHKRYPLPYCQRKAEKSKKK